MNLRAGKFSIYPFSLLGTLVALPILYLFRQSFIPNQVLFSNDGPLGAMVSQADTVLETFTGLWRPLNWIGNQDPSSQPDLTMGLFVALGSPVLFAKFYAPCALLLLGASAWFFARRAGFQPWVSALTAAGAALSSNPVSYACWGLPAKAIALACTLVGLGLILDRGTVETPTRRWLRTVVAGFFVGLNVVEGADVGAIFSLYVAAFAIWQAITGLGAPLSRLRTGGLRLVIVAICAGWIAAHSLSVLISTQIVGISGARQDEQTKAQQWDFVTGWSFPKVETIRFLAPGILGYRMDTPDGGAYWGGVGQDGTPQTRFNGSGEYPSLMVLLGAGFALAVSIQKKGSPLNATEKRMVWFWAATAGVSLVIAFGRFAPLYRVVFSLPYFSTIRVPMKFLHGMHLSLWILFAYGLEAMGRLANGRSVRGRALWERFMDWREKAGTAERCWAACGGAFVGMFILAAIALTVSSDSLNHYLATIRFGESEPATANFAIREAWLSVLALILSLGSLLLILSGGIGQRPMTGWAVAGVILVVDLVRSDIPWVKYYDYKSRYQSNAVVDLLKEKPWNHRVTAFLNPRRAGLLVVSQEFAFLEKEWLENHFQYYNIQSLDIDQMPRIPELEAAYLDAFLPKPTDFSTAAQYVGIAPLSGKMPPEQRAQLLAGIPSVQPMLFPVTRLWELTNTKYLLGLEAQLDLVNDLLDPAFRSIKPVLRYGLAQKEGVPKLPAKTPIADAIQQFTAVSNNVGPLAVLEFGRALPRAKLFSNWTVVTNDQAALDTLRSPSFDPARSVLLDESFSDEKPMSAATDGEVEISHYTPKRVVLATSARDRSVLLMNDRWHPDWKVSVDGVPAKLLRANFIMRGVGLSAGRHSVEFRFDPPHGALWVSLSAEVAGLLCIGFLLVYNREKL